MSMFNTVFNFLMMNNENEMVTSLAFDAERTFEIVRANANLVGWLTLQDAIEGALTDLAALLGIARQVAEFDVQDGLG